jgi:23S rRNA pseudouridine1911/1915/1917 synthase
MPTRRLGPHDILYEDNHLLVVNKPCGLATMGVPNDETSLVELARHYLKLRYAKPGNVYLGVVSRLDRLVSGAIVLARTSKAAARLTRQFLENRVEKTYWALVAPPPPQPQGVLESWVSKNDARHRMEVVPPKSPGAQVARLSYGRRARLGSAAWLEVELETGRKHQIRLQLAELGSPILGDRKYGSSTPFPAGIALHARRLAFEHPVRRTLLEVTAPLPPSWRQFARLSGSAPPWRDDPSG